MKQLFMCVTCFVFTMFVTLSTFAAEPAKKIVKFLPTKCTWSKVADPRFDCKSSSGVCKYEKGSSLADFSFEVHYGKDIKNGKVYFSPDEDGLQLFGGVRGFGWSAIHERGEIIVDSETHASASFTHYGPDEPDAKKGTYCVTYHGR